MSRAQADRSQVGSTCRPWRVVIFSTVGPAVLGFDAILRAAGHEPVAVLTPRLPEDADPRRREFYNGMIEGAPAGLDLCLVPSKDRLPRLVAAYEPDLGLCMGYPWKLPREVLEIPRLGVLNGHPSLLPRHRGPIPMAWAIREGDAELGMTYHLMDEELDTGAILAQGSRPLPPDAWFDDLRPLFPELVAELLPEALARLAAGERGDPQPEHGATYAGLFEPDYVPVDWSKPAREIHTQARAWSLAFAYRPGERGPIAELDGERVRLLRTSLAEVDGARRVECGDGPLWIVETEPA